MDISRGSEDLKKAALFFAKEIDQRLIDLLRNIIRCLGCVGSSEDWRSAQMRTITTGNTGRQITIPKNLRYRSRSGRFTTSTMEWTDTGA